MRVRIFPGRTSEGEVTIPASKSLSHRVLISAALAEGTSVLHHVADNQDTEATLRCLKALGAGSEKAADGLHITGIRDWSSYEGSVLDCGESGSTLRFLIPLAAMAGKVVTFTGHGKLMQRPQSVYEELFREKGLLFEKKDEFLRVQGPVPGGEYVLKGDVSSQFITGLLFTLPLAEKDSVIRIIPPYESRSYVLLTEQILKGSGITIHDEGLEIRIPGNQHYRPSERTIEGDDSQAAFFEALGVISGKPVCIHGINPESMQGDHAMLDILRKMGGSLKERDGLVIAEPSVLHGTVIDLENCPDLGPVLFAAATQAEGVTKFIHAGRLRIKESDRIDAMEEELTKLGAVMHSEEDSAEISGKTKISGGVVLNGHNDHRIVMALAVLACNADSPVTIEGAEAVSKSYPDFFKDLKKAGVKVEQL